MDSFHRLLYRSGAHWSTTYLGLPVVKTPQDMWVLQEIITAVRPQLIIECGTFMGTSALYYAHLMDLLNIEDGHVATIDITDWPTHFDTPVPTHPRVTRFLGSSIEHRMRTNLVNKYRLESGDWPRTLIFLDSQHERAHVLAELHLWAPLVSIGSYLIVEDTNVNGHPVQSSDDPGTDSQLALITADGGPYEAVQDFLSDPTHLGQFEPDLSREHYFVTYNPSGYLLRLPNRPPI